ncbi:MAG: heme-binding protein, partial [Gammaproteobacteria bacterium]
GALGMGVSGRVFGQRLSSNPVFATGLSAVSSGQFLAVPGGVLILDEAGSAIGAVGVSGDNSERDEFAAISGISAAGFASEPAEPLPDWNT